MLYPSAKYDNFYSKIDDNQLYIWLNDVYATKNGNVYNVVNVDKI